MQDLSPVPTRVTSQAGHCTVQPAAAGMRPTTASSARAEIASAPDPGRETQVMSASRHVEYARALAVLPTAALACSALAACGSVVGTGTGSGDLCGNAGRVDRLVVKRVDDFPQNHPHFTFPAKITVRDPAKARSVALAVCALPAMPRAYMSCPVDFGIIYRLTFTAEGKNLPPVRADPGGCSEVRGIGQTRWAARAPGFWRNLGAAMGIGPNNLPFGGRTS